MNQKKQIYNSIDQVQKELNEYKNKKEQLNKKIDPKVQSANDIQKTIKSL